MFPNIPKLLKLLKLFTLLTLLSFLLFLALPLHPELQQDAQGPTLIQDRNGRLLYEVRHPEHGSQQYLSFDQIPELALSALISIEDRRFYAHMGVRPTSVLRALWQNYEAGEVVSGGSTITQQLVRIRMQPKSRGYAYKLYEMLQAIKLETRLSKKEILESYLNTAFFGEQAYGLKAASMTFFGKSPAELSLAETSFLIGLLQSPTGYNPNQYFERAKQRQQTVLKAMKDNQVIGTRAYEEALEEPLRLIDPVVDIRAPHFVFWVMDQMEAEQGQTITTTLDLDLQSEVELIVTNELKKLEEKNVTSSAVVVLDVHTGEVLSMVGSSDFYNSQLDGQVNVAVSSRQPGSALKPFTYALSLLQGDTLSTTVADVEAQFFTQDGNPYIPRNYDYGFHGLVRYREALANSYNIPAVKTLEQVGVARLQQFLTAAGISTLTQKPEFYGVALTLGSGEVKLLELTQAYGIFPRGGRTLPVQFLLDDADGDLKLRNFENSIILPPQIAWLITDILSDNEARIPEFGDNSPLYLPERPVAAKTGTTRNSRDNWTIGFTPDHLVGVWVGNADNSPMRETTGVSGAGPIFNAVMKAVNKARPPKAFARPGGLVTKEICRLSGMLPTEHCEHTETEWYIAGTEPRQPDTMYQALLIDTRNGLRASEGCDPEYVTEQVFINFPDELEKWARENGYPEAPVEQSPFCESTSAVDQLSIRTFEHSNIASAALKITRPHQGDSFRLDPLIPDEDERITFEAHSSQKIDTVLWRVESVDIGEAKAPDYRLQWQPTLGKHAVSISLPDAPEEAIDTIWIEVVE